MLIAKHSILTCNKKMLNVILLQSLQKMFEGINTV